MNQFDPDNVNDLFEPVKMKLNVSSRNSSPTRRLGSDLRLQKLGSDLRIQKVGGDL